MGGSGFPLAAGVRRAVLRSSSQALLLQLRAALHGHVDRVLEASERPVCLLFTPGLLLSSPAQVLALSCTQFPKLQTTEPFLSSRHSLRAPTSNLSP